MTTRVLGHTLRYALLPTSGPSPRLHPAPKHPGLRVQWFQVPPDTPRESFDLVLAFPDGDRIVARRAVRVLRHLAGPLRIVVLADHQLWDPSGYLIHSERNAGAYPRHGERKRVRAMARQGMHEIHLLDPDWVIHLGDLVFGLDVDKELPDALSLWDREGVPAGFFVPGNHDGYARFGLNLRGSLSALALGLVRCRRLMPTSRSEIRWGKIWRLLTCLYGDLRPVLFKRLLRDGLRAWRQKLGPDAYAFELGRFRFVGLNSYDGSPARRHAYSIWVNIKGLHLGAPMVDNYGGTLSPPQVRFLRAQAAAAEQRGQHLVVFGHHDPRGNPTGPRYHENQPFPTDPVGVDHFEAWNFDAAWDSDPRDGRGRESPRHNSAHALLEVLSRAGGIYLSGHVHRDREQRYAPGQLLVPGLTARRPVHFITVTTASAAPQRGGYWGYRLLRLLPQGSVEAPPYLADATPPLLSIPAGNLWLTRPAGRLPRPDPRAGGAVHLATLHTGLPRPVTVRVQALLPRRKAGYRFRLHEASGAAARQQAAPSATGGASIGLVDMTPLAVPPHGGDRATPMAIYDLRVTVPAAGPDGLRKRAAIRRFRLEALPLRAGANQGPTVRLWVAGRRLDPGALTVLQAHRAARLEVHLADPEGGPVLSPVVWVGRAQGGRGRVLRVPLPAGSSTLRVRAVDGHGAVTTVRYRLHVRAAHDRRGSRGLVPGTRPAARACFDSGWAWLGASGALLAAGLLLLWLPAGSKRKAE